MEDQKLIDYLLARFPTTPALLAFLNDVIHPAFRARRDAMRAAEHAAQLAKNRDERAAKRVDRVHEQYLDGLRRKGYRQLPNGDWTK
jgi:hypothetical protein